MVEQSETHRLHMWWVSLCSTHPVAFWAFGADREFPAAQRCGAKVTQVLETAKPRLAIHYSVLYLAARMMFCVGGALAFVFVAGHMRYQNWFTTAGYACAAILMGVALTCAFRLLTAKGQIVVSIDATGFKDARLTPALIPWSAIRSVYAYKYRSSKANRVALAIDPAFKRGLSIRLGAKLFRWADLSFGSVFDVGVGTLEADADEIAQAAEPYIVKKPDHADTGL